jgi:hypothetical protein
MPGVRHGVYDATHCGWLVVVDCNRLRATTMLVAMPCRLLVVLVSTADVSRLVEVVSSTLPESDDEVMEVEEVEEVETVLSWCGPASTSTSTTSAAALAPTAARRPV